MTLNKVVCMLSGTSIATGHARFDLSNEAGVRQRTFEGAYCRRAPARNRQGEEPQQVR